MNKDTLNEASFVADLEQALQVLRSGGVIVYPTDTIWGIGGDATDPAVVERIFEIKNRPAEKAMIILVADERDILQYVANPDPSVFELLERSEKPTTVIYNDAIGLAENLTGKDGTVAIRVCKDDFCRQLIKRFRKPLVSTSANISGMPSPALFRDIDQKILGQADYIVQYRQQDTTLSAPSSVIRLNKDGSVTVIRE